MSGTPKGNFPKSAHLLKHADFQRVYQLGKRHFSGNMTVFYLRTASAVAPLAPASDGERAEASARESGRVSRVRVGFTVPRAMGKAVQRNRIRRRVREAVRFRIAMLADLTDAVDIVINPKQSASEAEFTDLLAEVERAFHVVRQHGGAAPRPRPVRSAKKLASPKRSVR